MINVKATTQDCVDWIRDWYNHKSGGAKGIIIGISGGKDSTVVAKLCCEAIGKNHVFGVLMPHTTELNDDSLVTGKKVCEYLDIDYRLVNIAPILQSIENQINFGDKDKFCLSNKTKSNIPPRIRMMCLYAMGQEIGYRVVGTGNLSESTIGWCTKWGDTACDFNPIANFTKTEVVEIGKYLGIPKEFIEKTPADGLTGKSDEENFGFTYELLDAYIGNYLCFGDITRYEDKLRKIENMERVSKHKLTNVPKFPFKEH